MDGHNRNVGSKEQLMQTVTDRGISIACLRLSPGIRRRSFILQYHRGYFVGSYPNEKLCNNRGARAESETLKILAKLICWSFRSLADSAPTSTTYGATGHFV